MDKTDRQRFMHYYRMGKIFGYPKCCINYFCQYQSKHNIPYFEDWPYYIQTASNKLRQKRKPFIPCLMCARRIHNNIDDYLKSKPDIIEDGVLFND